MDAVNPSLQTAHNLRPQTAALQRFTNRQYILALRQIAASSPLGQLSRGH